MGSPSTCLETGYLLPEYWLDANTFIQAKNGHYGFDIVPGFWEFLDQRSDEGVVSSSTLVYDELVSDFEDELADWVKERRGTNLFLEPDEAVQDALREIAQHVNENYEPNQAAEFLAGADPWLIAHARAQGGKVVTQEVRVGGNSKKVKIPNVCDAFGVESVNMYQMLRESGASLR